MCCTAKSGVEEKCFGQTVFSDTHVANLRLCLVGSDPWHQDTSFCDHLPSAAPSVRYTEGAARHFSAASNHNQPHDESSLILATTISVFVEMLSEFWRRHSRAFFLHDRKLGGRSVLSLRSLGFSLLTLSIERLLTNTCCKSATRLFASFKCAKDCVSTLEKHEYLSTGDRKRVASLASSILHSCLACVATLKPFSGTLGKSISLEAIEDTRLLHGFYIDESSARYVMQPSKCIETDVADLRKCKLMNELADPEHTAVYAQSQNETHKRHDSIVTLTAPENLQSNAASWPAMSSAMVFATRLDEHVHHTTDAVQSSLRFWLPSLPP